MTTSMNASVLTTWRLHVLRQLVAVGHVELPRPFVHLSDLLGLYDRNITELLPVVFFENYMSPMQAIEN
jgi:hypothetical protein